MPMRGTGTTALKIVVNVLVGVAVGLGAMPLAKHQIAPQHNPWHCAVGFRRPSHRPILAADDLPTCNAQYSSAACTWQRTAHIMQRVTRCVQPGSMQRATSSVQRGAFNDHHATCSL
jgi:hypothetical protein